MVFARHALITCVISVSNTSFKTITKHSRVSFGIARAVRSVSPSSIQQSLLRWRSKLPDQCLGLLEEAAQGKHLGTFIQPPAQHSAFVITAQKTWTRRFVRLGAGRIEGHQNEQAFSGLRRRLGALMYRQLSSQNGLSRTKQLQRTIMRSSATRYPRLQRVGGNKDRGVERQHP